MDSLKARHISEHEAYGSGTINEGRRTIPVIMEETHHQIERLTKSLEILEARVGMVCRPLMETQKERQPEVSAITSDMAGKLASNLVNLQSLYRRINSLIDRLEI